MPRDRRMHRKQKTEAQVDAVPLDAVIQLPEGRGPLQHAAALDSSPTSRVQGSQTRASSSPFFKLGVSPLLDYQLFLHNLIQPVQSHASVYVLMQGFIGINTLFTFM